MNELKRKISGGVKSFVDKIFDETDEAEKEARHINKSVIGKGLNELYNQMDISFIEFSERNNKNKKRW